jgi:hypothetical protein
MEPVKSNHRKVRIQPIGNMIAIPEAEYAALFTPIKQSPELPLRREEKEKRKKWGIRDGQGSAESE